MEIFKKFVETEIKAKEYGFYWPSSDTIIRQVKSEIAEIEELIQIQSHNPQELQAEIGDLLHAAISLCLFYKFDPESTLSQSIKKFEQRFQNVQKLAAENGLTNLQNITRTEALKYWDRAKLLK